MITARGFTLAVAAAALAAGCGGGSTPAPEAAARQAVASAQLPLGSPATLPAPVAPQAVAALPKQPEPGPPLSPRSYEVKGRRDPFATIALPKPTPGKVGVDVSAFKLAGIIHGPSRLALLEAPDGVGYILKPGEMLGDARIAEITDTAVTFAMDPLGGQRPATVTLRLKTD
jgi:hypothetical protein